MGKMLHGDLVAVFKKCAMYAGFNERWFDTVSESHGLPYVSRYIIENIWLMELPENEYTKTMREQLLFLSKHGHFNVFKDTK